MAGPPLEEPGPLRARVASGFAWGVYISVLTQVTRTVVAIVLVRLLTPEDYGLAAMAFIFAAFVSTLSDASLGKALIQRPLIDEIDRSTVFWATVGVGAFLSLAGFLAAGLISTAFDEPAVKPLVAVLSLSFVIQSAQMTHAAILQRHFIYRATALRFTVAIILSGAVGIVAAALGAGPWALIYQQLVFVVASGIALWLLTPWHPHFVFSWRRLRSLMGFGLNVMGTRVLTDVSNNAGPILVGRFLGTSALGVYSVALNLITMPVARLVLPIQESLFPAYARIQDDTKRVRGIWLRTTTVVVSVMAPTMVGLAIVSDDFVTVVLGSRWSAVAPLISILAGVAIAQALSGLAATVLLALDRSSTVFRWTVVGTLLGVAACVVGLRWGTTGVAASLVAISIPLAAAMLWSAAAALELSLGSVVRSLRGPAEATVAMATAVITTRWLMDAYSLPAGIRLAAAVLIGATIYVPVCFLRVPAVRAEVVRLRRPRFMARTVTRFSPAE